MTKSDGSDSYIRLNNGQKMPKIGMGTSWLGDNLSKIIEAGIDEGYRMIDSAKVYGNESTIGEVIKKSIQNGKVKREELFLISKLSNDKHRKEDVLPEVKDCLKNFQVDYLDLYLIHYPGALTEPANLDFVEEDTYVPFEETWMALEECVKMGLIKGIGVSNFNSVQIQRILKIATIKPVVNEVECNPYFNQEKLLKFCKEKDIVVIGFSPFYSYNKPLSYIKSRGLNLLEEPIIMTLANKYKKTCSQIILKFLIQRDVVPIPKTGNIHRLSENFNVFDFTLSDDDMEQVMSLNSNIRCIPFTCYENFHEYPFKIEY